ncbi:MAG TPA: NAD(P)/FAD-dependent oxidoreductase [Rhizobiaceae bacterium]|nr:NAD(P)/FAD-dependent oxidoreductase [Rhizobiaceae bacterium]
MQFEVIVVGGSYAGLSGALQLARARRRILVIDEGTRRNRFADSSHGFLGQDGRAPGAIQSDAREQLLAYDTVTWVDGRVTQAWAVERGFGIRTQSGDQYEGRRLLLATGVRDELPDIPGLAERWGRHVFHCPYCHGYELDKGKIAVLAVSPVSMHHAMMLPDWGETTLLLNGAFEPDAEQAAALSRRGVTVEKTPVRAVVGPAATVELEDDRVLSFDGMFTAPRTHMASPLAEQLGCAFDDGPMGAFVRTGMTRETTAPGVFACGDAARAAGSVALAVGDGTMAGAGVHQSLIFRET